MDRFWKSHFSKTLAYIFVNRGVKFDLATLLQRAQARLGLPGFLILLFVMLASRRFHMAAKLQQVSDCLPALFGDRPLVVRAAVVDVRESSGLLKYSSDTQRQ